MRFGPSFPPALSGKTSLRFWVLILILALLGFCIWRISLPFRLMRPVAQESAKWEIGKNFLAVGPVQQSVDDIDWTANSTLLQVDWMDLILDPSLSLIEIEGSSLLLPPPDRFTSELFTSRWKKILRPEGFPFEQIQAPAGRISIPGLNQILEVDLTVLRNRAGAIETTGVIRQDVLEGTFFLRLGWDTLESGGSFKGTLSSDDETAVSDWFSVEPLRSFLQPFSTAQIEGSLFLNSDWIPLEAVLLVSARRNGSASGETGNELQSLSGSLRSSEGNPSQTRFLFLSHREKDPNQVQLEVYVKGNSPIRISGACGSHLLFRLFADAWEANAAGRLVLPSPHRREIRGRFFSADDGGLVFRPLEPLPDWSEHFTIPGIFSFDFPETIARIR